MTLLSNVVRVVFISALFLGCGSSSGGGNTSNDTDAGSNDTGGFTPISVTIADLQTHDKSTNCDPQSIENVLWNIEVKGAVVVGGKFAAFTPKEGSDAEALDGYYISSTEGGANNGIQMAVPASLGTMLVVGDTIDVAGEYMEYYCNSQIKAASVTKTGTADVPAAVAVSAETLTDASTAEAHEGVLVTLTGVDVMATQDFNVFSVTGGVLVGGKYFRSYEATIGDKLTTVTGVLDWSYGEYKVEPRGDDDVVVGELAPAQELTIADIQTAEASTGCDPSSIASAASNVLVKGAVVIGPRFIAYSPPPNSTKEALDGYYVGTTEGGANSGIQLVVPVSVNADLKLGDVVDIEGETMEYYCLSQLKAKVVTPTGDQVEAPTPTALTAEITGDLAVMETYEGSLVSVENVTVTEVNQYGEFAVTGDIWVGDLYENDYAANVGDELTSVMGVLDFSYGSYKIQPRVADDVVVGSVAPPTESTIAEVQQQDSSLTCAPAEPGGTDPAPKTTQSNVMVTGIVLSSAVDVSSALNGVYLGTDPSGSFSGLFAVYPKTLDWTPTLGDEVKATGSISEFFCFTQITATTMEVVSSGNTIPAPLTLTPAEIAADGEQYEGTHVTVENVTVTNIDDFADYQQFKVTGGLAVSLKDFSVTYQPTIGGAIQSMTGALKYSFGEYKLVPFGDASIQ